jgi:phosphoribosylglycinamide formyltransferase 2
MVTLAGTQNFNEFELHLRAILSLPIFEITLEKWASAVLLASENSKPTYSGISVIAALAKPTLEFSEGYFKTLPQNGSSISQ